MDEQSYTNVETEAIATLARKAVTPHGLDPAKPHVVVVGENEGVETIDLERFLPEPLRQKGVYTPGDVQSFMDYVRRHRDTDGTTIWVDVALARITAVLNDGGEQKTGWADHRAVLQLTRTPEWQHWLNASGSYLDQATFAEHLQDGVAEIRHPDAATMLEVAQTIQGKTKADWKSATRLDNGAVGFAYQEEIQASAGRSGTVEIPAEFVLGVAPFYGEPPFEINARLRYRVREGHLTIGYKLERPNDVELSVIQDTASRLETEGGFDRVYMGAPPA